MTRERVVFDANVLISGVLSATSTPAAALKQAISTGQLLAFAPTLRELMRTLRWAKFDAFVSREHREALLLRLAPLVEIVEIIQTIRASRDPKDDKLLELAVNGCAEVLVSGDQDLLGLNPFQPRPVPGPPDTARRQLVAARGER